MRTKYLVEKLSRPVCRLRFTLFKWPFSYTLHIHAHLVPVTALYRRFPQFHSKLVYMLKMLFDRDTNKCFDKDITKYLDKYHNKPSISTKPSSSTSTKTSASTT